jgi:methyltransferase (TIGR00027 family)
MGSAMKQSEKQVSKTALAVLAFLAAADTDGTLPTPFSDPMARRLIGWSDGVYAMGKVSALHRSFLKAAERSDPGAYGFMVARALYIDDVVRKEIAEGVKQIVMLGAGYDTRPYRMADELGGVTVFELDLPAMSQRKQRRVARVLGQTPENVRYVAADFREDNLLRQLHANGYNDAVQTLFVLSGVSMYLDEQAMFMLLSQVGSHLTAGTSIVFDFFFSDLLSLPDEFFGGPQWIARAEKSGEKPGYGLAREDVEAAVSSCGLQLIEESHITEISDRYLRREDGTLAAKPYDFAGIARAEVLRLATC